MVRENAAVERFFKVLLPGFQEKLNLPRAFCRKQEDEPQRAILECRKGKWKIGTCRNSEGVISFEDGWPEFADHHSLSVGDFVVFEHSGEFRFNVVVFGPNACEKGLPVGSERGAIEAGIEDFLYRKIRRKPAKDSGISYHNKDPYFVVTMRPYLATSYQLGIPKEFVVSNDLGEKAWAILRNSDGEESLKDGDVCVFVLNRCSRAPSTTVSFDVEIFRQSAPK